MKGKEGEYFSGMYLQWFLNEQQAHPGDKQFRYSGCRSYASFPRKQNSYGFSSYTTLTHAIMKLTMETKQAGTALEGKKRKRYISRYIKEERNDIRPDRRNLYNDKVGRGNTLIMQR